MVRFIFDIMLTDCIFHRRLTLGCRIYRYENRKLRILKKQPTRNVVGI